MVIFYLIKLNFFILNILAWGWVPLSFELIILSQALIWKWGGFHCTCRILLLQMIETWALLVYNMNIFICNTIYNG